MAQAPVLLGHPFGAGDGQVRRVPSLLAATLASWLGGAGQKVSHLCGETVGPMEKLAILESCWPGRSGWLAGQGVNVNTGPSMGPIRKLNLAGMAGWPGC